MKWAVFGIILFCFTTLDLCCYFSMPFAERTSKGWVILPGAGIVQYLHYSACDVTLTRG